MCPRCRVTPLRASARHDGCCSAQPRTRRRHGAARRGRSTHQRRTAGPPSRGPARHRSARGTRSRARGTAERAVRGAGAQGHDQPRAGRPAEGVGALRFADRARHPRGERPDSASSRSPRYEFAGELALTGELRAVRGALAMALAASRDGHAFVLPAASAGEAARVRGAAVYGADSLLAVCAHLTGVAPLAPVRETACVAASGMAGPRRRTRTGAREARARDRRCGRALAAAERSARHGQVDARATVAVLVAAAGRRRGTRGRGGGVHRRTLQRDHMGPASVPRAAPHGERRRAGRRRQRSASGRDFARASRRAVPGRAAGVGSARARSAARAARVGRHPHLARRAAEHVSGAVPAGGRDESLSVRLGR